MPDEVAKIYHRGEGFSIASIPEHDGPVVVLEAQMVAELGRIWHAANARVAAQFQGQGFDSLRNLCEVMAPVFKPYRQAMVEWSAERPLPAEVAEIEKELEDLRRILEEFDPDNWPGGKGPRGGPPRKA